MTRRVALAVAGALLAVLPACGGGAAGDAEQVLFVVSAPLTEQPWVG
jgi:ABC-type glycerol-3-phosphate transport system substrate-binding protein